MCLRACFASVPGKFFDITSARARSYGGHGLKGMSPLFAESHSQFAAWAQSNPTSYNGTDPVYNFDGTAGGLTGMDLR